MEWQARLGQPSTNNDGRPQSCPLDSTPPALKRNFRTHPQENLFMPLMPVNHRRGRYRELIRDFDQLQARQATMTRYMTSDS